MIVAGLVVEHAERFKSVKPQAWFDSPAQMLPDDPPVPRKRQDEQGPGSPEDGTEPDQSPADDSPLGEGGQDQPEEQPAPTPEPPKGTIITEEGITSSFTVTRDMLDDNNFETLEHVTARVWITHERRGDVEVELKSPNEIVSVLARARRFDEDAGGFDGWKFMSLRHWCVLYLTIVVPER